jgi:hypothetical protein
MSVTFTPPSCATSTSGRRGQGADVPMPLTAITRDLVQTLIGNAAEDFAALIKLQAKASGSSLPEALVGDGLSS